MGCDKLTFPEGPAVTNFNPRTRMGCDPIKAAEYSPPVRYFNPRTRMGCDTDLFNLSSVYLRFQSTHPHGVRLVSGLDCRFQKDFNPRTRMGCDVILAITWGLFIKFQSTHPHGVRREQRIRFLPQVLFQSTHPHGVRRLLNPVRAAGQ